MDYTKDITNHQKGKYFSLGDRREFCLTALNSILCVNWQSTSTVLQILSRMNSSVVLILIPVDMEMLMLNVPILLAIATLFAGLKDFLQVILLLVLFEQHCKNTGLWMPAMVISGQSSISSQRNGVRKDSL